MAISNTCSIEGCNNMPFISCGGNWICGECMVKWNKAQSNSMKNQMEMVINGS